MNEEKSSATPTVTLSPRFSCARRADRSMQATIKSADMPEEVQKVAIEVAVEAMAKFDVEKDVRCSPEHCE